ncbi:archease [Candidatus Woesearchaeota archaeon]|nr:archease [Candidatus Woesearchaeota archaeon]
MATTRFRFLPKTATADVAFKAFGSSPAMLITNAALAVESVMVDLRTIKPDRVITKDFDAPSLEKLVFNVLDELVFLKDAEQFLASKIKVKVRKQTDKNIKAVVELEGQKISQKTMTLHNDVKAVTYHMFEVKKTKNGYEATVLVDV